MTLFDPVYERELLESDVERKLDHSQELLASDDPYVLASASNSFLNFAVACLVVSYDEPAYTLVARVHDALGRHLREKENTADGGIHVSRDTLLYNSVMSRWLLTGEHDAEHYAMFVNRMRKYHLESKSFKSKPEINLTLPYCVDAGAYERALVMFEEARMKPPASPLRIRSEGQMSYVLARYRLGQAHDAPEVEAAIKWFLKFNVNTWLVRGHSLRAAHWMKMAHWSGEASAAAARTAVLACYEYLAAAPPAPRA